MSVSYTVSSRDENTIPMATSSIASPGGGKSALQPASSIAIPTAVIARPKSPPDAPPAYELALAMRRAAAAAIPSSIIPGRAVSVASSPPPINRPTSLPTTRSRVPSYQQEQSRTSVGDGESEPPIRLMETSL
jgi:hypothetical protein